MRSKQNGISDDWLQQVLSGTQLKLTIFALVCLSNVLTPSAADAEPPQIPAIFPEERSDWINLQKDVTPAARGDGQTDDTAAIQKAFDEIKDGDTLYLPAGTYRLTAPLTLRNPSGKRWIGGLIIGHGRDTKLIWDGQPGTPMLILNGIAYSRFVGLDLNGKGKASVGFHYQSTQGFQTEVVHRHLAFHGFTDTAVLEQHPHTGKALAETMFENCLFEDCQRGVALLQFNDYDYTFDGCEFRRCGVGIDCFHGSFYARNCHFQESSIVDIRDWSEHSSSIRRCTSTGSQAFVIRKSTVAPLTVQDCHIDSWKSQEGALQLSRPPVLIFDCTFTNPPLGTQGVATPAARPHSAGQQLLVSCNQVPAGANLVQQDKAPQLLVVPPGKYQGVVSSPSQSFLNERIHFPKRVFDAKRDFGAKADGVTDDTASIQKAIEAAAAASGGAIAYLPTGNYVIKQTLSVTGKDYFVGGSGCNTKLIWRGEADGTMVEVRNPDHITLEQMAIGSHDSGPMNNGIDILQKGSAGPSHVSYDGIHTFGKYQKEPLRKGFRFEGLDADDVVLLPHVQGNIRFINSGQATIVSNCSYEGSVVVEGKARGGLLGFQTRLATIVTHGLYLHDNNDIVMSDFYVEQAANGYLFQGAESDLPGRATITGGKLSYLEAAGNSNGTLFDIRNYHGQLFIGPYQYYQHPKKMRIQQDGTSSLQLLLLASAWYGATPDVQLGREASLSIIGNEYYGSGSDGEPVTDATVFKKIPDEAALATVRHALDDLRRLGKADLQFNHSK